MNTRDKLLDAAARLFAERGVFNVPLAEIVRQAGQRNPSAIHYHFGGRDQVLLEMMEPHVRFIRERRQELFELARKRPDDDLRSAVESMVRPVCELAQRGWRERAYLRIGSELADNPQRTSQAVIEMLFDTASRDPMRLMARRAPSMPAAVWSLRVNTCIGFVARAAAERGRQVDAGEDTGLSDDAFVSNLVDMYVGALTTGL